MPARPLTEFCLGAAVGLWLAVLGAVVCQVTWGGPPPWWPTLSRTEGAM